MVVRKRKPPIVSVARRIVPGVAEVPLAPFAASPMAWFVSIKTVSAATTLDAERRRRLKTRGRQPNNAPVPLVLNTEEPDFNAACAAAIADGFDVLLYKNAQRVHNQRTAGTLWPDIDADPERLCLIRRADGVPKKLGSNEEYWTNITKAWVRTLIADHMVADVIARGARGVFLDSSHMTLNPSTPYAGDVDLGRHCTTVDTILYTRTGGSATIALVADGVGPGNLTNAGSDYTFHFQSGVTTVGQFEAAITATTDLGIVLADPAPGSTMGAGDAIAAVDLPGGAALAAIWGDSYLLLLEEIRDGFDLVDPTLLIGVNGMWNNEPGQVDEQDRMMDVADIATCEHTGFNAVAKEVTDPYVQVNEEIYAKLAARPTKSYIVRGTVADTYYPQRVATRDAGYTHGCRIADVVRENVYGQHAEDFQATRLSWHRVNTLGRYFHPDLPLGRPLDAKVATGTGFTRAFQGGLILVAPELRGVQATTLPRRMFGPDQTEYPAGTVVTAVGPEVRYFLDRMPPAPPAAEAIDVAAIAAGELLLEDVVTLWRRRAIRLQGYSTDPASAIRIRGLTDSATNLPFIVVNVTPEGGTFVPTNDDIPYRQTTGLDAIQINSASHYPTDGSIFDITVDIEGDCDPYEFFNAFSLKLVGAVTLLAVQLLDPVLIDPQEDPLAPAAAFTYSVNKREVTFDDSASAANGGATIVSKTYDFGDGSPLHVGSNPTHTYDTITDKSVSLTVVDSNGREKVYPTTVKPTITSDGPTPILIPHDAAEYTAIGAVPPDSLWIPGAAAPGATQLDDVIGALNLSLNAFVNANFQQPVGVADWNLLGLLFDEVLNQRASWPAGTAPNPATDHIRLTILAGFTTPAAISGIMSLGSNHTVRSLTTGRARHQVGRAPNSVQKDGTAIYNGVVAMLSLDGDPTADIGGFESSFITPAQIQATPWEDPLDTSNKGIGGINPATSSRMVVIWAELRYTPTALAQTFNDLALKMRLIEEAGEA